MAMLTMLMVGLVIMGTKPKPALWPMTNLKK